MECYNGSGNCIFFNMPIIYIYIYIYKFKEKLQANLMYLTFNTQEAKIIKTLLVQISSYLPEQ